MKIKSSRKKLERTAECWTEKSFLISLLSLGMAVLFLNLVSLIYHFVINLPVQVVGLLGFTFKILFLVVLTFIFWPFLKKFFTQISKKIGKLGG